MLVKVTGATILHYISMKHEKRKFDKVQKPSSKNFWLIPLKTT